MVAYLGATACRHADLTVKINRRVLLANLYTIHTVKFAPLRPFHATAPAQGRTLKAERYWRPCYTGVSRRAPMWPISPCWSQLGTDCYSAASDGKRGLATARVRFDTQKHWPRLAVRTSRRPRRRGGYISRTSWPVLITRDPPNEGCSGTRRGERVLWEGKSRTG